MLEQSFVSVYDKFKLHFYRSVFDLVRERDGSLSAMEAFSLEIIHLLDEPTVGLDPKQIIEIRTLIKKLGKNRTVILSSHILSEVQAVCDKIVVINEGKVVADDTEDNLSRKLINEHLLTARIEGKTESVEPLIKSIKGVIKVEVGSEREKGVWEYRIEAKEGVDIRRELFKRMAERNMPILDLRASELSLEDIFLKLTMGEAVPGLNKDDDDDTDTAED
jgi:ABC-2 type transport system ATP-binding protein